MENAEKEDRNESVKEEAHCEEEEKLGGPQFLPKLYLQRYYYVQQILTKYRAEKIVDFGSAECRIARFLSRIPTAVEISLVDIDKNTLELSKWCIRPMTCDFIIRREKPLNVRIYEGSVTQYDDRLKDCDAVTLVEVIEHLVPDVLSAAIENVFRNLKPRIVVITTPNADFNVLFPGFKGFRHWDHKFEWSRVEFQEWCADTANRYGYSVEYGGIGKPAEAFAHLGCCSQAAIFKRTCHTNPCVNQLPQVECYQLIAESSYPYKTTEETVEDPLLSEIDFQLRLFQRDSRFEDGSDNCLVPVRTLLGFRKIKNEFTEDRLSEYLRNHGYRLSEDDGTIILPAVQRDLDWENEDNSDSDSTSDNVVNQSKSAEQLSLENEEGKQFEKDEESWD